jgi:hypothetical protein
MNASFPRLLVSCHTPFASSRWERGGAVAPPLRSPRPPLTPMRYTHTFMDMDLLPPQEEGGVGVLLEEEEEGSVELLQLLEEGPALADPQSLRCRLSAPRGTGRRSMWVRGRSCRAW